MSVVVDTTSNRCAGTVTAAVVLFGRSAIDLANGQKGTVEMVKMVTEAPSLVVIRMTRGAMSNPDGIGVCSGGKIGGIKNCSTPKADHLGRSGTSSSPTPGDGGRAFLRLGAGSGVHSTEGLPGGTGRRARLKILCPSGHPGSIPGGGTIHSLALARSCIKRPDSLGKPALACTQNPVGFTPRGGSIPPSGTRYQGVTGSEGRDERCDGPKSSPILPR